MRAYLKDHEDEISRIAIQLADNFAKPLYDFSEERSYSGYMESLKEIIHWSNEFYMKYGHKLNDWESFELSLDNIFNAVNKEEFILAWGKDRINLFFDENAKSIGYSPGKTG